MPPAGLFLSSCTLYSIRTYFCLDYSAFCLLFLFTTHNTNIHAFGGVQTRNSSKRSAADPRLRRLGHWDRQGFDPRTVHPAATRYTYCAIPAHNLFGVIRRNQPLVFSLICFLFSRNRWKRCLLCDYSYDATYCPSLWITGRNKHSITKLTAPVVQHTRTVLCRAFCALQGFL